MSINLDTFANFVWDFGQKFLITVQEGTEEKYYVWSDPDYYGDNTIRPYFGDPNNFTKKGFCGRDKGDHYIKDYCGSEVKFVDRDS